MQQPLPTPDPPHPPPPSNTLQQPIAIPSTSPTLGSPFLRAYPIELQSYNLPPQTFLSFLDQLNRLMVTSPPLAVLGLAGDIVSMVPLATAQIVGSAVSAAATVTKIGMSKGLSAKFVSEANRDVFGPSGLKVSIVKLEVVAKAARMGVLDAAGKVRKDVKLLGPLGAEVDKDLSGQHRRLMAMARYTSPLEIMPDAHQAEPENVLGKVHAYASERQRSREEKKVLEKREKALRKGNKDAEKAERDCEKKMAKLDAEEEKVKRKEAKKPAKMESELRKIEKEREKVRKEYEEAISEDGKGKKDKEEEALRKILWLLIQKDDGGQTVQEQDSLQYWNTSAQYQDNIARYRESRQEQRVEETATRPENGYGQGASSQVVTAQYGPSPQYQ